MVKTTFSPDEMLEVAKRVYPDLPEPEITGDPECVVYFPKEWKWNSAQHFNPSLTGTDREQAQACQCIVAASRLKYFTLLRWEDGFSTEYVDSNNDECSTPKVGDILSASISAILSHIGET